MEDGGRSVEGTDKRRCTTMQTRRCIQWAVAAVLAAAAIPVAACSGSSNDKAGGADQAEPRVLTLANPNEGAPPTQLDSWAEEVGRLSGGTLTIEFENSWRLGEPLYEAGTLEDVVAGKVDMAWVGARVFDTVGIESFRALGAPLLVDSYDLEGKVFEEGIPERMLEGVSELDLVGIGVLPGPMRKVLGVSKPFVRPGDFAGEVVGLQDSAVADSALRALGATPQPVPSSAALDGLDAYEQQLGAIQGNQYDRAAKYVTANVNLWPRPLVIVMGKEAFESLTDEQQSALRDAAAAAIPQALAASRAEDEEAAPILCRRGLTFAAASESDLSELRAALEPVYADLRNDRETRSAIDAITSLKSQVKVSAEAPACESGSTSASDEASPIDGTYETTVTRADWVAQGLEPEANSVGVFTLVFEDGELTLFGPDEEIGFEASYSAFRDQIEVEGIDRFTARWALDGTTLTFTEIDFPGEGGGLPYLVVWGSHPWVRAAANATPIDGVYEFTTTAEELLAAGSATAELENYGKYRWTLDDGRFEMTQKNGAADRWTKGTYVVREDTVEFTVEDFGGVAPNGAHETTGEVFTYTWSLYRDQLTLGPVEGAISPENFLAKPWTRVG
jgi:TRAP-type C4-dicarboxylate transport system substrate-binding protein